MASDAIETVKRSTTKPPLSDSDLLVRHAKAEKLFARGNAKAALKIWRALLVARPDHVGALNGACKVLRQCARVIEPTALSQIALRRQPNHPALNTIHGENLRVAGDLAPAENAFRLALAFAPGNTKPLRALAGLLEGTGREMEAANLLAEVALASEPTSTLARQYRRVRDIAREKEREAREINAPLDMSERLAALHRDLLFQPANAQALNALAAALAATEDRQLEAAFYLARQAAAQPENEKRARRLQQLRAAIAR